MMHKRELGIIVLAAGKGTRMNSDIPKVLHLINGRTMISYVLECAVSIVDIKNIVVVIGHQSEKVKKEILNNFKVSFALQKNLLGTGDAVRSALPFVPVSVENILILCGDVPLIRPKTLLELIDYHESKDNDLTVLTVKLSAPSGYGRMILDTDKKLLCIREDADASPAEKRISIVNSGIYCVSREFLARSLELIRQNNRQREYYLTDIVAIARENSSKSGYIVANDSTEFKGVNTLKELKKIEEMIPRLDL